ncbi:13443_t:CDS:2 [Gigaspora rosea]|nr:13443_t:CDS:2 [Gigaspora rosea]
MSDINIERACVNLPEEATVEYNDINLIFTFQYNTEGTYINLPEEAIIEYNNISPAFVSNENVHFSLSDGGSNILTPVQTFCEAASTNSPETMDENNLGSPFDEANYENVDIDTCNGNVNMFTLKENQRFDDFDDAKPTYENMLSL